MNSVANPMLEMEVLKSSFVNFYTVETAVNILLKCVQFTATKW